MKPYAIKAIVLSIFILTSMITAKWLFQAPITPIAFVGVIYLGSLFVLVHYFTNHDTQMSENKKIRRLMLGSMIRLFFVLIFLVISLFNKPNFVFHFVIVFGLTFIFFLFFDILEMRTNLRPNSEELNKNTNV